MNPHLGDLIPDRARSFDMICEIFHIYTKVLILSEVWIDSAPPTERQV